MKKLKFIDLFSGVGGFTLGFQKAGFENVLSVDFDRDHCSTYKKNFPSHVLLQKDIKEISETEICKGAKNKTINVVIGGPPCQGFSLAGKKGRRLEEDPRNSLFEEFVRIISYFKPEVFVMENVSKLNTHNKGKTKDRILHLFESIGYKTDHKVLCAADFGVPQIRNRIFFIGNRINKINRFPQVQKDKRISIKEAINDLPVLKSGERSKVANHIAMNHTTKMLNKMAYLEDGQDRMHIPRKLRPLTGDSRKYIKYKSTLPSICITGDMRKVFHYSQNRALTVRELARIQSFPDDFVFVGSSISQQQQVGDAVPPNMAEAIAKEIIKILKDD